MRAYNLPLSVVVGEKSASSSSFFFFLIPPGAVRQINERSLGISLFFLLHSSEIEKHTRRTSNIAARGKKRRLFVISLLRTSSTTSIRSDNEHF